MNDNNIFDNYYNFFNSIINNGKISHAYLFELSNYELNKNLIYDFIKMLLFECTYNELLNFDNNTISQIDSGNYPDIRIIKPLGAFIKKNQLYELKNDFNNKSLVGSKRFYIIEDADKLNASSSNSLLKFLEEPEENIIAILVTNNRYLLLDTIISRCQIISINDECSSFDENKLFDLIEVILNPDIYFINYSNIYNNFFNSKELLISELDKIKILFTNYLNYNFDLSNTNLDVYNYLSNYNVNQIINTISILEEEYNKLSFNVNLKIWLDNLFSILKLRSLIYD